MNKFRKLVNYILHSPGELLQTILVHIAPIVPDRLYLKLLFRLKMGYKLNLDNPKTFNEKLQWLKLNNRKAEYTKMVDKFAVKEYVAKIIGEEYIIPTLGVWDKFEDIDFDRLPNQFVLKTTHGGGGVGVVICKDKSQFDIEAAKIRLNKALGHCIYKSLKEWPYKSVPRRIIAEKYMVDKVTEDNPYGDLIDYKFYCFNGCVKVCMLATERFTETGVCFDYFDREFNHYPFAQGGPNSKKSIEKPELLDEMIAVATKLSEGLPHVRVDLYCVDKQIYFGELTLFDSSGFAEFDPIEWDYTFGSWIELPKQ